MNEILIKHIKQVRLELEQLKLRVNTLEFKLNSILPVDYTPTAESMAKSLYNAFWCELNPDQKLHILELMKTKKEEQNDNTKTNVKESNQKPERSGY
jgi:hypothetical protein